MHKTTRRGFLRNALLVAGATPVLAAKGGDACCTTELAAAPWTAASPANKPLVVDAHAHMNDPAAQQDRELWRRSQTLYDGFKIIYDGNGEPHSRSARVFQSLDQLTTSARIG